MENIWITVFGIAFIFFATALGASVVFFFKGEISPKTNALFFGLASGIMLAASVWSLLLPSIEQAKKYFGDFALLPAVTGLIVGGAFLVFLDRTALRLFQTNEAEEGASNQRKKSTRLFLAVTLHNIPEGLAVGFAFGTAAATGTAAAYWSALGLALGIGLQNFPEGAAVALPLKTASGKARKAFLLGAGSGLVEPVFAIIGYFFAAYLRVLQPWVLAFSAGAMLFVVAQDLLPEAAVNDRNQRGAWGFLIGFILMMTLDVVLA